MSMPLPFKNAEEIENLKNILNKSGLGGETLPILRNVDLNSLENFNRF